MSSHAAYFATARQQFQWAYWRLWARLRESFGGHMTMPEMQCLIHHVSKISPARRSLPRLDFSRRAAESTRRRKPRLCRRYATIARPTGQCPAHNASDFRRAGSPFILLNIGDA